jgi:hypothetical protein
MMNNKPALRSKFRGGYQLWICLSGLCAKSQCRLQQKKAIKQTDELTEKKSTDAILCRETEELERQRMKVT